MDKIIYDIKELMKTSDGAKYNISIQIPLALGWLENVMFTIFGNYYGNSYHLDFIKKDTEYAYFSANIELPTSAIYHYYFSFLINENLVYYNCNNAQMSVNFEVPEWIKGKVIYHVFVDRFNRDRTVPLEKMSNRMVHENWNEDIIIGPNENGMWNTDFYGGNLRGIINKLDYIASLGTEIIYLSPICLSQSNHRYDTADYEVIDPYVGTKEDLKELCDLAHQKGIRIILDAVFNHTGNDSKYFNEYNNFNTIGAYQSPNSEYYDFYRKNGSSFNYWWDMPNLPVCDGNSTKWQQYIYGENGIIDLWFSLGIDGLRLDVADELSDSFIEEIRRAVKRNKPDGFILGEVWKNPMRMNRKYISSGKGMDSVMNYNMVDALLRYYKYNDINKLRNIINEIKYEYPKDTMNSLMNFTSTHDISRIINILGTNQYNPYSEWTWNPYNTDQQYQKDYRLSPEEYKRGLEIYKSYLLSLAFLPGNLSIFYGDEIGMQGMGNLANRRPFAWNNINTDLLNYHRLIGNTKKNQKFLANATPDIIDINDALFMFEQVNNNESALIVANKTDEPIDLYIPKEYSNSKSIITLNNSNKNTLTPFGGLVLKRTKNY